MLGSRAMEKLSEQVVQRESGRAGQRAPAQTPPRFDADFRAASPSLALAARSVCTSRRREAATSCRRQVLADTIERL